MKRKRGDICKETSKDNMLVVIHILTEDSDNRDLAYAVTVRIGCVTGIVTVDQLGCIDIRACSWDATREWLTPEAQAVGVE